MMWYFSNNIILLGHYCIFNATNVYLTLRQSIKLLTIEYQKGHTFLFSKKVGWVAPCPSASPPPSSAAPDNHPLTVQAFVYKFRPCLIVVVHNVALNLSH